MTVLETILSNVVPNYKNLQ